MKKNTASQNKAKLFNIKHFPMDLARILCVFVPAFFNIKKIYTSEKAKVKLRGRAIIVGNHTSLKDPLMLCCCCWYRRVFNLTAETVMRNKFLTILLRGVGCIPINRKICDIESIKKAVAILKNGHVLSLFPQGGIKAENDINTIKSGVVLMAMQSKSPVIPCYIHNKEGKGDRNCIVFGEPILLDCKSALPGMTEINEFAQIILQKMMECRKIYEDSRR